jgi:hypothetical protein
MCVYHFVKWLVNLVKLLYKTLDKVMHISYTKNVPSEVHESLKEIGDTEMTSTITVNYQTVTPAMIGAAHKVYGPDNKPFYKVENSRGELDADGDIKEYTVKAIRKNNKWHVSCDCKAGSEGRQCWHKRAAMAAAKEERDAMAEQVRLNEEAKAKRPVVTLSQEELDRFYSCRPDWKE